MVIVSLGFLFMWATILVNFLRRLVYRIAHRRDKLPVLRDEQPILVLEYDNSDAMVVRGMLLGIFLLMCLFGFLSADSLARKDLYSSFLFLNREHTYVLYYWAWKFAFMACLLWLGLWTVNLFNKKTFFFNDFVVVENALRGKKTMLLDNNVRLTKSTNKVLYWLYNDLSKEHYQIVYKKFMLLDPQQEKLLDEVLSKIPEKKKTFYL